MLASERQATILRGLRESGSVTVTDLARRLAVADETIRRDLAKLADRGEVVRTHGGAVRPDNDAVDPPFALRRIEHAAEKRRIGRLAARLVQPGDVIAIDASSTGLELARALPTFPAEAPVTVVSNGLDAVRWLAGRDGVTVISTGGEFDPDGACFVGPLAETTLGQFAFRWAFLSCRGLDWERGCSEASPSHASLKRRMLAAADRACLLVDGSKAGRRSVCYFASAGDFSAIYTDVSPPEEATAYDRITVARSDES